MSEQTDISNERMTAMIMAYRLFGGELSKTESDRILAYFTDGEHAELKRDVIREVFRKILQTGRIEKRGKGAGHAGKIWPKLSKTLKIDPAAYRPTQTVRRRPLFDTWTGRVAALMVAAVLASCIFFAWYWLEASEKVDAEVVATTDAPATFEGTRTISTEVDAIRHITLADGTRVTLNRNSTLVYNDRREAELSGEAWFDVTKDPEHPFVIHAGELKVTVLGTEFNFNTRTEDGLSKLSLYEGQVMFDHAGDLYRLNEAGQEFILDHATGLAQVRDFDPTQRPQWIATSEISSSVMSLGTILDSIEATYGVTIANRGAVDSGRRFKFVVDRSISIEETMEYLEYLNGEFAYTINGTTVTITKK